MGCDPVYPGDPVGTFDVTGHLEENSCGELAVPAIDPLRFAVEIRERSGEAFWRRPERGVVSGTARGDGSFRFRTETLVPLIAPDPDPDFGHAGCALRQTEVVDVTVAAAGRADGGVPDAGESAAGNASVLTGANVIDLVPEPGSDCTPALVVAGGPFLALPCRVGYSFEGEPADAL